MDVMNQIYASPDLKFETRSWSDICAIARAYVAERREVIRGHSQSGCREGEGKVLEK